MVIYIISVQYNGGFLPDIILLTQGYYHRGTRLNAMQWLCIYSPCNSILRITTMCDGVLHCLCFIFTVFLVSLHGD